MRPIWRGSITFALVNIPVRLYSAAVSREMKFKLLHKKDHGEIRYARICKKDEEEVPWKEVVKGYPLKNGKLAILTEKDFQKASVNTNRSIDILDFTDEHEIDTLYYSTPYYVEPEKGAAKAYRLFFEALKRSKKVAVGHFVFHSHEHLGVLRIHGEVLVLHQLRYHKELRKATELNIPKQPVTKTELDMALQLIESLSKPFHPERYRNAYVEKLKKLIQRKKRGEKPARKKKILLQLKESLEIHKKKKVA